MRTKNSRFTPERLQEKLGDEIVNWMCQEYVKNELGVNALAQSCTKKFRTTLDNNGYKSITYDMITAIVKWRGLPVRDKKIAARIASDALLKRRGFRP